MLPPRLLPLFEACRAAGGRALLVGGTVRDALLGIPPKDLDIEVHQLPIEPLSRILRRFGHVNEVGRSFGVLKLRSGEQEIDVSIPRRDSKVGSGHRGIHAEGDPELGVVEAARRRDLTINAIAWDPLEGVYEDPFGGRRDLADGILRAVDATTFGEDPLRALRVAQFAARFPFRVDPALEALAATMPLRELPAERIRGEVEKLLLKGIHPIAGWDFAHRTGLWAQVLPLWGAPPPDLDAMAARAPSDGRRRLALMLAAGSVTVEAAADALERMKVFKVGNYPVREQVLFLCETRGLRDPPDPVLRRLGDRGDLPLLAILQDNPGLLARAEGLGVAGGPLPPLLQGRDLPALGLLPGPRMGVVLAAVREAQLDGEIGDAEGARALVRRILAEPAGG